MLLLIGESAAADLPVPTGVETLRLPAGEEGLSELRKLVGAGVLPEAAVVGPGEALPLARLVRHVAPTLHLALLSRGDGAELRRALRFDPQLGGNWSVLPVEDPAALEAALGELVATELQRRRLRATLDRINAQMGPATLQERLAVAESRLASLLTHAVEAIFTCDTEGRILAWNRAAERSFGWSEAEAVGRSLGELLEGDPAGPIERIRGGRTAVVLELRRRGRELELTLAPILGPFHDFLGISGTARDVTDQRRAEAEIRALNANLEQRVRERTLQLEEANRELESFSYSVSHDLRAPLRHVAGFADLLRRRAGPVLDEQGLRYLETIRESASRAGTLIDELLRFSRMGRAAMRFGPVDMEELVRTSIAGLAPEQEGREVAWHVERLPTVRGDAGLLRLVWDNLLSNAIKYTRPRPRAEISIGCLLEGADATFTVADNGVGFDMRFRDKLFGVFQRLHTDDEFEGTGIGLANVRRIVARHGGRTWAESEPGRGARFHFSLQREGIS